MVPNPSICLTSYLHPGDDVEEWHLLVNFIIRLGRGSSPETSGTTPHQLQVEKLRPRGKTTPTSVPSGKGEKKNRDQVQSWAHSTSGLPEDHSMLILSKWLPQGGVH